MGQAKETAEQEIEHLTAELDKQKAEFEEKIKIMLEKSAIAKEKAVLQVQQELQKTYIAKIDKQFDKIQSLATQERQS